MNTKEQARPPRLLALIHVHPVTITVHRSADWMNQDEMPSKFYLAIRHTSLPNTIWVINRLHPFPSQAASSLELTPTSQLTHFNTTLWTFVVAAAATTNLTLKLLDSGNLVLLTFDGVVSWQTFDTPRTRGSPTSTPFTLLRRSPLSRPSVSPNAPSRQDSDRRRCSASSPSGKLHSNRGTTNRGLGRCFGSSRRLYARFEDSMGVRSCHRVDAECDGDDGFKDLEAVRFGFGNVSLVKGKSRSFCERECLGDCGCVGLSFEKHSGLCKKFCCSLSDFQNLNVDGERGFAC
ncbi:uncharacterized protein HKW66_Vig0002620 [Vigna angularis]|uniref:Apple domain-containing protein n=1 Tax=Phaseolus angularis TaxID=3914 RepID=A0A8T0LC55_PHAAN|nr:uncharacterized protein HKW66_Vig0002620 [Vigna angularis]